MRYEEPQEVLATLFGLDAEARGLLSSTRNGSSFRSIEEGGTGDFEAPLCINEEEPMPWGEPDPPHVPLDVWPAIIEVGEDFAKFDRGGGGFLFTLKEGGPFGTVANGIKGGISTASSRNSVGFVLTAVIGVVSCDFMDG